MTDSILLSGPAGSAKSALARALLEESDEPAVAADFQSIVVALLLLTRGPSGRYPLRPSWILPLAEYVRRAVISGAVGRDLRIIATNSDGDPERRAKLLAMLGSGARELVVLPGGDSAAARQIVTARLGDAVTGELSRECETAVDRWFKRYPA